MSRVNVGSFGPAEVAIRPCATALGRPVNSSSANAPRKCPHRVFIDLTIHVENFRLARLHRDR